MRSYFSATGSSGHASTWNDESIRDSYFSGMDGFLNEYLTQASDGDLWSPHRLRSTESTSELTYMAAHDAPPAMNEVDGCEVQDAPHESAQSTKELQPTSEVTDTRSRAGPQCSATAVPSQRLTTIRSRRPSVVDMQIPKVAHNDATAIGTGSTGSAAPAMAGRQCVNGPSCPALESAASVDKPPRNGAALESRARMGSSIQATSDDNVDHGDQVNGGYEPQPHPRNFKKTQSSRSGDEIKANTMALPDFRAPADHLLNAPRSKASQSLRPAPPDSAPRLQAKQSPPKKHDTVLSTGGGLPSVSRSSPARSPATDDAPRRSGVGPSKSSPVPNCVRKGSGVLTGAKATSSPAGRDGGMLPVVAKQPTPTSLSVPSVAPASVSRAASRSPPEAPRGVMAREPAKLSSPYSDTYVHTLFAVGDASHAPGPVLMTVKPNQNSINILRYDAQSLDYHADEVVSGTQDSALINSVVSNFVKGRNAAMLLMADSDAFVFSETLTMLTMSRVLRALEANSSGQSVASYRLMYHMAVVDPLQYTVKDLLACVAPGSMPLRWEFNPLVGSRIKGLDAHLVCSRQASVDVLQEGFQRALTEEGLIVVQVLLHRWEVPAVGNTGASLSSLVFTINSGEPSTITEIAIGGSEGVSLQMTQLFHHLFGNQSTRTLCVTSALNKNCEVWRTLNEMGRWRSIAKPSTSAGPSGSINVFWRLARALILTLWAQLAQGSTVPPRELRSKLYQLRRILEDVGTLASDGDHAVPVFYDEPFDYQEVEEAIKEVDPSCISQPRHESVRRFVRVVLVKKGSVVKVPDEHSVCVETQSSGTLHFSGLDEVLVNDENATITSRVFVETMGVVLLGGNSILVGIDGVTILRKRPVWSLFTVMVRHLFSSSSMAAAHAERGMVSVGDNAVPSVAVALHFYVVTEDGDAIDLVRAGAAGVTQVTLECRPSIVTRPPFGETFVGTTAKRVRTVQEVNAAMDAAISDMTHHHNGRLVGAAVYRWEYSNGVCGGGILLATSFGDDTSPNMAPVFPFFLKKYRCTAITSIEKSDKNAACKLIYQDMVSNERLLFSAPVPSRGRS